MSEFHSMLPDAAYGLAEKVKLDRIRETLENSLPFFRTVAGIVAVGSLGLLDYLIGNQIFFSFFYLVPIVLLTWTVSQGVGLLISLVSAFAWLMAESAVGVSQSSSIIYFWNTLIHTGFFVFVTCLVAELHKSRNEQLLAAHTDFVTGVANARYFNEFLHTEIERIQRYPHPITVVYLDIDNFKLVNDLFGHKIGDEVLRCIASELKSQLRSTDVIARLGGDEFAMLLPSTCQSEARVVVSKIRTRLMQTMKQRNWPVTFSMGAVTCMAPPHSAEQLVDTADKLMYEVKNSTKNAVRFGTWTGELARR